MEPSEDKESLNSFIAAWDHLKLEKDSNSQDVIKDEPLKTNFGKYRILSELGRGGMGIVFLAEDTLLKRKVALKVIQQLFEKKHRERFIRESQMMARLEHPNIVRIFESGEDGCYQFFAMEMVEGKDLSHILQQGLSLKKLVSLLVQVADAVYYAHEQGVIHRDLKPSNIMVTQNYQAKVMDFGLAKDLTGKQLSKSLDIVGTPEYMSPEQAHGSKRVNHKTDIYSLGIILYQMLVGRPPFSGNPINVIYQIVHDHTPYPSEVFSRIPAELEAICLKAIEKNPHKRYSSAKAFADDLKNYLAHRPISVKPVGWVIRTKQWIIKNRAFATTMIVFFLLVQGFVSLRAYNHEQNQEREIARQKQINKIRQEDSHVIVCSSQLQKIKTLLLLVKNCITSKRYVEAKKRTAEITQQLQTAKSSLQEINPQRSEFHTLMTTFQVLEKIHGDFVRYGIELGLYQHEDITVDIQQFSQYTTFASVAQPSFQYFAAISEGSKPHLGILSLYSQKVVRIIPLRVGLSDVAFSPDDNLIAYRDRNGSIFIETIAGNKIWELHKENSAEIERSINLQFSPNGKYLLAIEQDFIKILDIKKKVVVYHQKGGNSQGKGFFHSSGTQLVIVGTGPLMTFSLKNEEWVHQRHFMHADTASWSEDGNTVIGALGEKIFFYSLVERGRDEQFVILYTDIDGKIEDIYTHDDYIFFLTSQRLQVWSYTARRKIMEYDVNSFFGHYKVSYEPVQKQIGIWTPNNLYMYTFLKNNVQEFTVKKHFTQNFIIEKTRHYRKQAREINSFVALGKNSQTLVGYYWPACFYYDIRDKELCSIKTKKALLKELESIIVTEQGNFAFHFGLKNELLLYQHPEQNSLRWYDENKGTPSSNGHYFTQYKDQEIVVRQLFNNKLIELVRRRFLFAERTMNPEEMLVDYCAEQDLLFVAVLRSAYVLLKNKQIPLFVHNDEFGEITTLKYMSGNLIYFTTKNNYFCIYNWKDRKRVVLVNFSQPVVKAFYNKQENIFFLKTQGNLWVYRFFSEEEEKLIDISTYYPFSPTKGMEINDVDFSEDFRKGVFAFYNGRFAIFDIEKNE